MRKSPVVLPVLLLACCALVVRAQNAPATPDAPPTSAVAPAGTAPNASATKARAALEAMVKALGGDRWLNLQNVYTQGRIAAFYQGKPTGGTIQYWDWKTADNERLDLDEKAHDRMRWVQIYTPKECWEVTYRGKKPLQALSPGDDPCGDAIRRHEHSVEAAVRWMNQPDTVLLYEGQQLVERRLADQVTLLNSNNDSITILMDADTHLPLKRTYYYRDPVYKDKNQEDEEYDDYHPVNGLPVPFSITRLHNGDMTQQRFVFKAGINVALPADGFDADALAQKIAH
ncbi:MAG: hypothetical protein WA294_16340 [Acidobacteriaceae bacterium]